MRRTWRRSISGRAGCSSSDRTIPNGPRGEVGRVIEQIQRFLDALDRGVVPHAAAGEHLDLYAIGRSALILYQGLSPATGGTKDFDAVQVSHPLSALARKALELFGEGTDGARRLGLGAQVSVLFSVQQHGARAGHGKRGTGILLSRENKHKTSFSCCRCRPVAGEHRSDVRDSKHGGQGHSTRSDRERRTRARLTRTAAPPARGRRYGPNSASTVFIGR
jgi:hypothetical protein